MNGLSHRVLREFKAHFGRYLALFLMITLGMYLVVSVAGMAERTIEGSDRYNEECKLQDGQFTTFVPLSDASLDRLEQEYGTIEPIFSIDVRVKRNDEDAVIRVFKNRSSLNLLKLDKGSLPADDSEIVIMNLYADRNNLSVGDSIHLGGREYRISGLGCIPDYNLPLKQFADMTADPERFGIGVVTDAAYDEIFSSGAGSSETYTYAYRLKDGKDAGELKNSISKETDYLETFSENKDNPRIASDAASDVILKRLVSLVAGAILVMLFAYVISVFIIHQINEESSVIGTLYAMGVSKGAITAHYILLPTIVTFVAGLVGMVLGFSPLGVDFQMQDSYLYYSIPKMDRVYPLYIIIYCIVMPPVIAIFVNLLVIRKKLSRTPLSLIRNEQDGLVAKKEGRRSEGSFLRQFTFRQLSREKRSVITVVIGMAVALLIFMIGLNCYVLCSNVKKQNIDDINYKNMYVLKYPMEKVPDNAEACFIRNLSVNYLDYSLDVSVIGIDKDNKYFPYKTSGNQKELVIARSTAQKYGLSVGDTMVMEDSSADREYAFTVSDIVDYSIGLTVYMDIDEMRKFFGEPEGYYNMLLADEDLDIEESRIYSVTTGEDIENSAGIFVDQMMSLIVILLAISILIFIAVMFLMLNVMIDRAAYGISLVKIFGYRLREIRRVYLDGNFYAVLLGSCIIIPIVKMIADSIYPYFIANTAMGMDLSFPWYLYAIVLAGAMLIYLMISSVLTGKIRKIVPAEVLKNRE